jgi:hypothetical protein
MAIAVMLAVDVVYFCLFTSHLGLSHEISPHSPTLAAQAFALTPLQIWHTALLYTRNPVIRIRKIEHSPDWQLQLALHDHPTARKDSGGNRGEDVHVR